MRLGRFSLALDGTYGDDGGSRARSTPWQRRCRNGTSFRVAGARWSRTSRAPTRELAARMHLALGRLYLERLRVNNAMGSSRPRVLPTLLVQKYFSPPGACTRADHRHRSATSQALKSRSRASTRTIHPRLSAGASPHRGRSTRGPGSSCCGRFDVLPRPDGVGRTTAPFIQPGPRARDSRHDSIFSADRVQSAGFASLLKGDAACRPSRNCGLVTPRPADDADASDGDLIAPRRSPAFEAIWLTRTEPAQCRAGAMSRSARRRIEILGMVGFWQMARRRAGSPMRTAVHLDPDDGRTRIALANAL